MNPGRSAAGLLALASILLSSCGPSSGGGAASSQPPASSVPPALSSAPVAASDTAASGAGASALPPVAAAPAARQQPTAAELLRDDPGYGARDRKLDALYQNAKERDPTGQVEREQASALAQRRACTDKACLDRWFSRREAALRTYVEN